MDGPANKVAEFRTDMCYLKNLWDLVYMVTCQVNVWQQTLWDDINTDDMEDQTKSFVKDIRQVLLCLLCGTHFPAACVALSIELHTRGRCRS